MSFPHESSSHKAALERGNSAHLSSDGFSVSPVRSVNVQEWEKELAQMRRVVIQQGGSTKGVDDATLIRFLKARSMHIDKAAKMFVNYRQWRESFVPWGFIPDEEVSTQLASNKILLQGASKTGWPLLVVLCCKHHHHKHNFEEFRRFVVHLLDKAIASARPEVDKIMVIADLSHIGYKNLDVKACITGFQLLQNYYPERLGSLYMVNTSHIFMGLWKVISRVLDNETKQKINFLSTHEMRECLLGQVDENVLPTVYGGKAEPMLLQDVHVSFN